jgi:hypothetical protein
MNNDPIKNLPTLNLNAQWAKDKLDDILFGCVLNIKLFQSGICEKLIINMDSEDLREYGKLLDVIFNARK